MISITTGPLPIYIQREGSRERERGERDIALHELIDLVSQLLLVTTTTTEILQGTKQNLYIIFLLIKQCLLHTIHIIISSK